LSLIIAVPHERRPGERRVALDPSRVERLIKSGVQVRIEAKCGHAASFHDNDYHGAAVMGSFAEVVAGADIVVKVVCPTLEEIALLPPESLLICIISAYQHLDEVKALRDRRVILLAMDHLPRTTRAQPMDALSSQATVAGYKAALLAAELSPRLFPMLTTAAGTIRPSRVLVIGAGVAGLQAIATAKRLGAQVEAYDIRRAAKEQIESVGARMVDTGVEVEGAGGFARALRKDEKQKQHDVLAEHLAKAHVVICAAAIPGRRAPRIITEDMVDGMLPESVIVDMAASTGGNCELTRIGERYYHNETVIVGPLNLPSHGAVHASEMYSRNVYNMLELIIGGGEITLNPDDEIISGCVLLHDGQIHHEGTAKLLDVECFPLGGVIHRSSEMPDPTSGWLNDESPEDSDIKANSKNLAGSDTHSVDSVQSIAAEQAPSIQDSVQGVTTQLEIDANSLRDSASMHSDSLSSLKDQRISDESDSRIAITGHDQAALDTLQDLQNVQDLESLDGADSGFHGQSTENSEEVIETDDLTLIDGVGPALQGRLYAFGYTRWCHLAALNDETVEKLSIQLELDDQIKEQNWSGQARRLMESKQ
jgi:NAD(P) transhydrogenase subunit alpha